MLLLHLFKLSHNDQDAILLLHLFKLTHNTHNDIERNQVPTLVWLHDNKVPVC